MSYFLAHLPSGWHVDEAIKSEEDRVVVIRFGNDANEQCMRMDETIHSIYERLDRYAVFYLVNIVDVPDFNKVRGINPCFDHQNLIYFWSRCMNCMMIVLLCSSIGALRVTTE